MSQIPIVEGALMHKGHLVGCGIGIAIGLAFVGITGGSARSLGFLVSTLICPVAMIIAMKFLMGSTHRDAHHHSEPGHVADGRREVNSATGLR